VAEVRKEYALKTILGKPVLDDSIEALEPKHTALVIIDMQNDFAHPKGHHALAGEDVGAITEIVPKIDALVAIARACGVMCIWIKNTTLAGGLNKSPASLSLESKRGYDSHFTLSGTWGHELTAPLHPQPNEPVIEKPRSDSYIGTPLDLILRSNDIRTLVHCGCVTEGCVESTVRSSAHHDYYTYVVRDCVASLAISRHEASLANMDHRYNMLELSDYRRIWEEWSKCGQ
jgi:ureidoacrylate peracid hydrolase